jgi:hypothetical protein
MDLEDTPERQLMVPVLVLSLNALIIAGLAFKLGPLPAAKILFIEISLILGFICWIIVIFQKTIVEDLSDLEQLALSGRDEAQLMLRQGRASLYSLRQRLESSLHPEEDHLVTMVKHVVPFLGLFIAKEKNLFRWGVLGWKIAANAIRMASQQRKINN